MKFKQTEDRFVFTAVVQVQNQRQKLLADRINFSLMVCMGKKKRLDLK